MIAKMKRGQMTKTKNNKTEKENVKGQETKTKKSKVKATQLKLNYTYFYKTPKGETIKEQGGEV